MTPTRLHAVARKAEAITPDADLLARYTHERDNPAFEELVRRHGPLVWAVCRHMLPHRADAEDAFQAVFLALVRSAPNIRDGRTIPAWLHGVAVRIATRARREFARRRARERVAALPEADRPVSDVAWESLIAAVHEEIQQLPEAERTAFVLCELQGLSQPDVAARLGWPLGSVSGRLCKARQRLLNRLTARGVAPAAAVGVGLTAGAASAVPAHLFDAVKTFPTSPVAASAAATALARGLLEGVTMRVKLTAAAAVMVAAIGLTGGAMVLSHADAQPPGLPPGGGTGFGPGGAGGPPPGGGAGLPQPGGLGQPPGGLLPGGGGPGGAPGAPGAPGGGGPGVGAPGGTGGGPAWSVTHATWDYKFVDVQSDRKEFEKAIVQNGKEGWEFSGSERFGQNNIVLVFKKKKGGDAFGGFNPFGGGGAGGMGGGFNPIGGPGGVDTDMLTVRLKHASAADVANTLSKIFGNNKTVRVLPEHNTNTIFVVASAAQIKDARKLIEELDAKANPGTGGSGAGSPAPGPGGSNLGPPPGTGAGTGTAPTPGGMGPRPAPPHINIFNLKHAKADEMVVVLKKLYSNIDMTADSRTNSLIVRANESTLDEIRALLARLDMEVTRPK